MPYTFDTRKKNYDNNINRTFLLKTNAHRARFTMNHLFDKGLVPIIKNHSGTESI